MNWRQITGAATILAIVGGTIYAIKKSLDKDDISNDVITAEEAKAEVYARKDRESRLNEALDSEGFEEMVDDVRDEASWNRSFRPYDNNNEEDNSDVEDDKMIHDPNSIEARNQYKRMELAEWSRNDESYGILDQLFDFPFIPKNDGDNDLKTKIVDYRSKFFGFSSKWVKEVTFAEVVLYYAKLANYNCDESVRYWVNYFLQFNELHYNTPSMRMDTTLDSLNNHNYFNEDTGTFGLFGLTHEQMNQAVNIANKNVDKYLTYEIEFNEFLKGCI
jgi:hypothetical protein